MHLAALCLVALIGTSSGDADWKYGDKTAWDKRYPQFCAGEKQSPIDLDVRHSVQDPLLKKLAVQQNDSVGDITLTLKNDGHKLELSWSPSYIRMGIQNSNLMYTAAQLHWHWGSDSTQGSEHTVDRRAFAAEGHLVFYNELDYKSLANAQDKPNGLAVLGAFYEASSEDNPLFRVVEAALKNDAIVYKGTATIVVKRADFDLIKLFLPKNTDDYFRYDGSLTTPPCYESVLWTVYRQPVPISPSQLELLRRLKYSDNSTMVNNFRPTLLLNPGNRALTPRTVYRTFSAAGTLPKLSLAAMATVAMLKQMISYTLN